MTIKVPTIIADCSLPSLPFKISYFRQNSIVNLSRKGEPGDARDEFEDAREGLGLDVVADGSDEDGDAAVVGAELVVVGEAERAGVGHLAQDRAHRRSHRRINNLLLIAEGSVVVVVYMVWSYKEELASSIFIALFNDSSEYAFGWKDLPFLFSHSHNHIHLLFLEMTHEEL